MRSRSRCARRSTTSFSRVPPGPMAPGSSPPWPGSSATMISRSVRAGPAGLVRVALPDTGVWRRRLAAGQRWPRRLLPVTGVAVALRRAGRTVLLAAGSHAARSARPADRLGTAAGKGGVVGDAGMARSRRGRPLQRQAPARAGARRSGSPAGRPPAVGYRSNTSRCWYAATGARLNTCGLCRLLEVEHQAHHAGRELADPDAGNVGSSERTLATSSRRAGFSSMPSMSTASRGGLATKHGVPSAAVGLDRHARVVRRRPDPHRQDRRTARDLRA
jgi:hypothetical protein